METGGALILRIIHSRWVNRSNLKTGTDHVPGQTPMKRRKIPLSSHPIVHGKHLSESIMYILKDGTTMRFISCLLTDQRVSITPPPSNGRPIPGTLQLI